MSDLDYIEATTGDTPTLAVIWLHGLGADGHDFEPIVPELKLRRALRFIFPHAPVRPVTINGGYQMRAWYDVFGWGEGAREDAVGIHDSAAAVTRLIDAQIEAGIESRRIVIAGFSQGGAIALQTALREPRPLGGVIALSTYLPLASTLEVERSAANAAIPIFMAHGTADPVLPLSLGERSRNELLRLHYPVEWHEYPMPHSVCQPEVRDIADWLESRAA